MVVAGYHLQPVHAAADEPFEEVAPVDFGFAPSDRSVQNVPFAVVIYAYCHEKGLFDDRSVFTDRLVCCIKYKILDLS